MKSQSNAGFTLIELLVGMILSSLVVTPLLSFMINIMDTDRKEQAKATSEQEIQSALDYIAQDLGQAVYIYDADGLNNNSTDTPPGIKDQIPPKVGVTSCRSATLTCVPILVFWKRELRQGVLPRGDDTFVYSLISYYLIKGNNANEAWSDTARIGRFQIRDGVRDPTTPTPTNITPKYITDEAPSSGFQLFDLTLPGTTLKDKMNRWQKASENYTDNALTLIDFIDQTPNGITVNCPTNTQQVPSTLVGGFYACVDSSTTSAQVHIRGNTLARLGNSNIYNPNQPSYFPTASTQIKGRGLLGLN